MGQLFAWSADAIDGGLLLTALLNYASTQRANSSAIVLLSTAAAAGPLAFIPISA